ncbi:MAG: DUF4405 domain-containing protein [Desulfobacterales bacterium]|nr:DUF4405 domain-containing protein [Desulfobacterales bacterium]
MSIRRITSLTAFLSFFIIVLTAIVLYVAPQGRIAYWADWRLWGLTKDQWGAIHINLGWLFLLSLILHIYYNWKPLILYLKNKASELKIFTKEFNTALIVTVVFIIGSYSEIAPFSTIISFSDGLKDSAAVKYGEPPYGHAELSSLKTFTKKTGIDLNTGIDLLKKAGIKVDNSSQTLKEVAGNNDLSPQKLYVAMTTALKYESVQQEKEKNLPETVPPGTGKLTLADFCTQYNLNMKVIIRSLKVSNIIFEEEMTIKKIAEENNISPSDIYEQIKSIAGGHR